MQIVHLKVLAGFLFLVIALLFGWTPLILLRYTKSETKTPSCLFTQHLHALASGVLLATCLLHLLPESVHTVHNAMAGGYQEQSRPIEEEKENASQVQGMFDSKEAEDNNVIENDGFYPLAELMLSLGFLFIYGVDSIMNTWHLVEDHREFEETELDVVNGREEGGLLVNQGQASHQVKRSRDSSTENLFSTYKNRHKTLPDNILEQNDFSDEDESLRQISGFFMHSQDDFASSDEAHPLAERQRLDKIRITELAAPRVRSLALVAALCIHGFFDGVMLGLQSSEKVLVSLMLALSLHKSFVAVSLSLTLSSNIQKDSRKHSSRGNLEMLYVFLFASVAPIGLILSSLFVHTSFDLSVGTSPDARSEVSVIPGCLQAFAVGTFLYVTFSELTEHSKQAKVPCSENKRTVMIRSLVSHSFLLVGFTLMAGLRAALD